RGTGVRSDQGRHARPDRRAGPRIGPAHHQAHPGPPPAGVGQAHNRDMRRRPVAAVLVILLVSAVTACTAGTRSGRSARPASGSASTAPRNGQALGAPGCRPASPVTYFSSFLPQVEGTGHGVTLWGLLMFPHPLPASVGDQEKIVWR